MKAVTLLLSVVFSYQNITKILKYQYEKNTLQKQGSKNTERVITHGFLALGTLFLSLHQGQAPQGTSPA